MSSTRWWMTIAAISLASLALARPAQAGGDIEVMFTVKPPDAKAKDAPQIEVTVIGAPNLSADKFVLVDKSAKPPVQLKASSRRPFNQGPETLAVAIVMLGWEMWIGNDTYRPKSDPTLAKGVLVPLKAALDKLSLKDLGPPGSVGTVIMYADHAKIRVPMGPLGKLTGAALGTQKDYANTVGVELVKGIELALAELHKVTAPRKVMIVLSDGLETNLDTAKGQLTQLKKAAATDGVQTFAIIYKAADSLPNNVLTNLTQQVSTVTTTENIAASLKAIFERIADRQYVTFPGYDKATKSGFTWDGKAHELQIRVDKDETEPQSLVLAPKWAPAGP